MENLVKKSNFNFNVEVIHQEEPSIKPALGQPWYKVLATSFSLASAY